MSKSIARLPRWITFALALAALSLIVAACGTASAPVPQAAPYGDDGQSGVKGPTGGDTSGGVGAGGAQPAASAGSAAGASGNGSDLYEINTANLLIIKTGTMDLQVANLDDALASASQKITALGGYLAGSTREGSDDQARASVTYRIPAARWDDALVAMRGLAQKVLSEQSQSQDVTGQVVDLTARITNLQATEQALQAIMARATKISDVLEVQGQLTEIRGQIEQASGERKHLQEQAAYSTLTLSFSLKPAQAVETTSKGYDPATEVDQASATLVGILQGLATAAIWFGIVWLPIIVALGVLVGVVIWVLRRIAPVGPGGPPILTGGDAQLPGGSAEA